MSGLILHRRAALVGSCATAALGISLVCGGYLEAGNKRALRPAGSLVMNNREVEISISENQLGLIATEEAERDALAGLAERFGLALENPYQDRLYLAFAPSSGAEELVQLARELRREGQARGLLKEAGLAAWTGEEPLVVTDELIVLFGEETSDEARQELLERYRLEVVRPDRFVKNQFLLTVTGDSPENALMVSQALERNESVSFAHPNFWVAYEEFETIPTDPLFARQWHHRNTGAFGGTVDADVDTSWAWDIAMGSSNVLISIQDGGTEIGHEDLLPNLFTNPGEVPGDNVDNDGNGFVDDVHGWDFINNDNDPNPSGAGDNHGTAVAGTAVARDSNGLGVVGSCPRCRVLPIRLCCTNSVQAYADAFAYSQRMGADIINNSWGHGSPSGVVPTVMANAINAAAAADSAVFFAAGNGNSSGWCNASFPSMPSVIAVSSASNRDVKVNEAAFGNCIDLMAPSHRGYSPPYTGTLDATTVDRTGTPGYNSASPPPLTCAQPEPADSNYTSCFGGTSFASPLAAGVAGLVRSAAPALDRSEVQHILQDTADKISPAAAGYRDETGFSNPAGGPATYAFGRVNAYEALKVAAPVADGGRGGVDIFLRDNRLDWGNTSGYDGEQGSNVTFEPTRGFIGHWQSVDIKVDAPPLQPTPPSTSAQFDALVHENPIEGANNRIYVRVHNRGPRNATSVHVKIHWAYAGAGLPGLPSDFWSVFPADSSNTSQVHPIGLTTISNLGYSGASVAGGANDASQIVSFNFVGPAVNPSTPNHYCLFAVIDSSQDPVDPDSRARLVIDAITPNDNNVTHRNIKVIASGNRPHPEERFYLRNPYDEPIYSWLRIPETEGQEYDIEFENVLPLEPVYMEPGEEILVRVRLSVPSGGAADVTFIQERIDSPEQPEVMGGMTYRFEPRSKAGRKRESR